MNISSWAIRNPVPVTLLFILLTILGVFSFRALPVQNMPDMDLPMVFVSASLEGAAPEQLETEVARKIEDKLATISRIDHIQTTITNGLVDITIIFELEKNSETALNEVRNAVESARNDLPADMTPPSVSRSTIQPDILATFAVRSGKLDETELSWFIDDELTKALLSVRGVGEVARIGGIDREIHVDLNPVAMTALGITAADVSAALAATQADYSGGRAEISATRQTVRTLGAPRTLDDIAALHISGLKNNAPVRLGEIAAITDTHADRASLAYLNGQPVIAVQIKRADGFSDLEVLEGARAALDTLRAKAPAVTITEAFTTINQTTESYDASMHMLWEGALIAIIVVFIFLKSWRATLIAAAALPLSIIPAFIAMRAFGFSLNGISLIALSLVIGVLVDDAIVEIENIARHSRLGKTPEEAAREATSEIGLAVVATTLTLVAVFLPTAFMGGIPGLVFRQFGITAAVAVLASLLVARLLTPVMAAKWMKPSARVGWHGRLDHVLSLDSQETSQGTGESPVPLDPSENDGPLMRAYLALVKKALAYRKTTATAVALFLAVSLSLAALLNGEFISPQDLSQTSVLLTLPPGSSLQQTEATAAEAAARIARIPEVKSTFAAVGTASSGDGPDVSSLADRAAATLTVTLTPIDTRKRGQSEIENDIRDALSTLPGVRVEVGASGDGVKLDINLASDDARQLETTAALLENQLRTLKGVGAVISSAALEAPEIQITPDFAQAAAHGVTTQAIADTARVATSGDYAARLAKLNLPERQIPIRVGFASGIREDIDALLQLRVPAAGGATVALGSVARIELGSGPAMISRLDRSRNITVSVELNGRALGEVYNEAMKLPVLKNLPEGVIIVEQGDAQFMTEMFESFGIAMLIGLFCIYGVLVLLFHDFLQPVTILMAIPLALGGALLPLVVTGNSFSMAAAIGLIMLMGIVTKNSILLVEYIIMSRAKGMTRLEAIIDACHKRVRPIIMTTLAMTGGMMPVILGLAGGDSSFRFPMAIVVAGGLMTSTLLSLVVIPVTYTLLDDMLAFVRRLTRRGVACDARIDDNDLAGKGVASAAPTAQSAPTNDDLYYMEKAPLPKAIAHLSIPLMLGMAATVIYNITDAFFIGQLNNTPMLSAVTLCLPVMTVLMAIGSLFGVGGGTEISRLLGEGKRDAAKATASFAFYGSLALGVLVTALALCFRAPIINLLGADASTFGPTSDFATVLFIGAPFMIATFALEQVVRAEGAAKVSMIGMAISAFVNLVLDPLFIFTFQLNVAGAAIATVLANMVAMAYFIWFIQRRSATLRGSLSMFAFTKTIAGATFKIGVSEFLMMTLLIFTTVVMNNYSASYDESVVASFGIAFRVTQLVEFFAMGLFMGVVPLLAYNYAAKNMTRLTEAIRKTSLYIGVITVVFCGVCWMFRGTVIGLFSEDAKVLEVGVRVITALLISALFSGYTGLFTAIFQATGKAKPATVISILRGGLFIPVIMLGNHYLGLAGIIWSLTVTEILCFTTGAVMLFFLKREIGTTRTNPAGAFIAGAVSGKAVSG